MQWPGAGELVATCGGGAEEALRAEIESAGLRVVGTGHGSVRFRGGGEELIRANLRLRTASRVLLPLVSGRVPDYESIYRLARGLPWLRLAPPALTIAVSAVVRDRRITDSRLAALKVKDAIVDAQRRGGARSSVDRRAPDLPVTLFVRDGNATISLDSSGAPLHERGYRTEGGEAPLRETVAAAMLRYASPPRETPLLLDPFCGSGTIAIEAALAEANLAPGTVRAGYAFERWPWVQPEAVRREREALRPATGDAGGEAPQTPRIVARDLNPAAVEMARRNAARAGVSHLITFESGDFFDAPPPEGPGVIVTNPPYGERLELDDARAFYRSVGDRLKQAYAGWSAWLLCANRDALKGLGLRTTSRRQLWNGGLDATLARVDLYR